MTYRPRSSVTTILAKRVPRSVVSAITHTPASGPNRLVTTPPMSSLSIAGAATCWAGACCVCTCTGSDAASTAMPSSGPTPNVALTPMTLPPLSSRSSDVGEMVDAEVAALGQDLGDAAAMAHLPVGLITQQAARRRLGELCSPVEVELGVGTGELLLDDPPKPPPFTAPVGEPSLRWRPEGCQMNISHPGILDRSSKLPFRKPRSARDRPVAHVEQCRYSGHGEGGDDVLQQRLLIADRVERPSSHALR